MANFMQVVTVTATTYPAHSAPTVDADFLGAFSFARESGTPIVAISFDGINDHGRLVSGSVSALNFEGEYERCWLRLTTAGTADVQVVVESRG